MATLILNENTKRILLNIVKEEKTHIDEFQTLLLQEEE